MLLLDQDDTGDETPLKVTELDPWLAPKLAPINVSMA
jgi:hypothetical protein